MTIESADYENVMIGRRGSSGVDLDKGYLRMKAAGVNKVILDTAGDSYLMGGNVGIGSTSAPRKASCLHNRKLKSRGRKYNRSCCF